MARTKKSSKSGRRDNASRPDSIVIRYDLDELPTAQHKAGLAGLLLQIESMRERKEAGQLSDEMDVPAIESLEANSLTIRLNARSTRSLFDDLYDGEIVEARSASKWPGKECKREEALPNPETGKPQRYYIYDVVQPIGHFLQRFTNGEKEVWHKLWRDMLWTIPCGPKNRGPFEARADGEPTKEGTLIWEQLLKHERARAGGGFQLVKLTGALLLGAQASNAEAIVFQDRADHALLLHFWPLTTRIFVPNEIDKDGKKRFIDKGFVFAIPEVSHLKHFCSAFKKAMGSLDAKRHGYRPAEAVISLPAQGPLEFMRVFLELAERKIIEEYPARYLAGIEYFAMIRSGNSVRTTSHGRVPPSGNLIRKYRGIQKSYRNPIFVSCLLLGLLDKRPWFAPFREPLHKREWSYFVHSTQEHHRTTPDMIGFAWEAHRRFKQIEDRLEALQQEFPTAEDQMTVPMTDGSEVDRLVYRLVGRYAHFRTLARLGIDENAPEEKWKQSAPDRDRLQESSEYQEERRRVCSSLFLELRSRTDDDFVRYFTATFGSVPQYLPPGDYAVVADALMRVYIDDAMPARQRTRDDVKTLTLLALSAHSRSLRAHDIKDNKESD